MGSIDPRSASFALLHRGTGDATQVVSHFLDLTGFRPDDIIAAPSPARS